MKFTDMNVNPKIIKALQEINIISPTEIQKKSISHMKESSESHLICQAKTGSGKTLAFAIPMVEKINPHNNHVQAVIMVPTRELCKQVSNVFRSLTKYKKLKIVEIYGGVSIKNQINKIKNGGQIVVATPGRIIDLHKRRQIGFKHVKYVALDEADRMLDMGFLPDMRYLLLDAMKYATPQIMLYSATLLREIKKLIHDFTKDGRKIIEIDVSQDSLVVSNCQQFYYHIHKNKYWNFVKILKEEKPKYSIIFTRTKRKAKEICGRLKKQNKLELNIEHITGDLSQAKREKVIRRFRNKKVNCIVATNVLARGLDFPRVSHVFNYDLPRDEESYVHRIGRTARVGGKHKDVAQGTAISIVAKNQKNLLRNIEKFIEEKIEEKQISGRNQLINKKKKRRNPSKNYKKKKYYGNKKKSTGKKKKYYGNKKKSTGKKKKYYGNKKKSTGKKKKYYKSKKKSV